MPIVIDTNSENLEQEMQQASKVIAVNKQADAKYFSKNMTGDGKRKTGVFAVDSDTLADFMKNKRRLLANVYPNEAGNKARERHNNQVFGNFFHQSTKPKEDRFLKFENNLTTMIPPVMLHELLEADDVALSFPRDSAMYNLNAFDTIWTRATSGTINGKPATTYIRPVIESVRMYAREQPKTSKAGVVSKESQVAAQLDVYILVATTLDDMDKDGHMVFTNRIAKNVTKNQAVVSVFPLLEKNTTDYDYKALNERIDEHFDNVLNHKTQTISIPSINTHTLELLVGDQSISEILKSQAQTMTHQAEDALMNFVKTFSRHMVSIEKKQAKFRDEIMTYMNNAMITFVQHIDQLNEIEDNIITTDLLAEMYRTLKENMKDDNAINVIARHSLRLLLSQRLFELKEIRDNHGLYEFEPLDANVNTTMQQNQNYSVQQKRIVTTTDPLVIGQAGAGSGKSHTLVGRINFMKDHGEDLSKVLVLSFTNVSALNINQRFPGVRSETLANMFHTIYSGTFPAQQLSQPSTVANSLRLLNPKANYFKNLGIAEKTLVDFINDFAERLEQFDQTGFKRVNLQQELKRMSNLIESNLELTTIVLSAVEQTTLELEPIIIHHMLLNGEDKLNIPDAYRNLNYIITDESQDISTFEYILLLELTIHYRSQLLIIGDGSQTLYEFRNSDPRYMNALEASGVFTSFKLETNYRSNEEILMFANQLLKVIDANKYANIQLTSSTFSSPTPDSVHETIKVVNNPTYGRGLKEYTNSLSEFMREDDEFEEWFISRVKRGEQVALMGWTRKEVEIAGEILDELLTKNGLTVPITNIMSNSERPMILLSRFARNKNETLRSLDPTQSTYRSTLSSHAKSFIGNTFKQASVNQSSFYHDFIMKNIDAVMQTPSWASWLSEYRAGKVNPYQVGSFLIQELLRAETRKNAMDQFLRKQKDVPNYDKCPIIISTIHGTKGLEFDHTVVLFNESKNGSTSQESLRMMFVALSRAKKSEFIINSHSASQTRTVSDSLTSMFQTPMETAMLRTLNDATDLTNARNASTPTAPTPPAPVGVTN